jgi:hypothetical protein
VSPFFVPEQEDADWEPAAPLCRFHLKKGGCAAGDACTYAHPEYVRETRNSQTALGVCRYYLSGTCRDGNGCAMRHLVACTADHHQAEQLPPSLPHAVAPKKRSSKKKL